MFPLRFNNFLACACLSDFLRYPCSSMTFLMNVFVIPFLPFFFLHMHLSRSPPLSIALPDFAALPIPSIARFPPYHSSSPACHSDRISTVILSCNFAMPLARTIKPLANRCHPLLSRIPFTIMQSCQSHSDFQTRL